MVEYGDVYNRKRLVVDPSIVIVDSYQHWTPENPCDYCGATSNTNHQHACMNYGLYSEQGFPIPAIPKKDIMDELVYFGASFHCIPLRVADQIRELLMGFDIGDSNFSFDYSQPILPIED